MGRIAGWMKGHKYAMHVSSFLLILLASLLLYPAAQAGAQAWIVVLLGVLILANLLTLLVE